MLSILLEHDGVVFPVSRIELVPEEDLMRVVAFLADLAAARCAVHGEPTTAAHVDVRGLGCILDEPCCKAFVEELAMLAAVPAR